MRKETYNIVLTPMAAKPGDKLIRRGDMDCALRPIEGYTFRHSGLTFGVTNKSPDATVSSFWTLMKLKSGYVCGYGQTRLAAITGLTESVLEEVKKGLQKIEGAANPNK